MIFSISIDKNFGIGTSLVGREVVILGYFNLPSLDCSAAIANVIGGHVPPREILFFDSFSLFVLSQWVKDATFVDSNNILNLVLTELDRIGDVSVLEPFPICHHCPVVVLEYVLQFTDDDNEDEAVEKYL